MAVEEFPLPSGMPESSSRRVTHFLFHSWRTPSERKQTFLRCFPVSPPLRLRPAKISVRNRRLQKICCSHRVSSWGVGFVGSRIHLSRTRSRPRVGELRPRRAIFVGTRRSTLQEITGSLQRA